MPADIHHGVIGVTDDGYPIVTENHCCPYFVCGKPEAVCTRECWYCKYADFRKWTDMSFAKSICRCPQSRSTVQPGSGTLTRRGADREE